MTCGVDPKSRRSYSELHWEVVVMCLEFPSEPQTGPGQRANCKVLPGTSAHPVAVGALWSNGPGQEAWLSAWALVCLCLKSELSI